MKKYALLSDNSAVEIAEEVEWTFGRVFFILFDEEQTDSNGEPNAVVSIKIYKDDGSGDKTPSDDPIEIKCPFVKKLSVEVNGEISEKFCYNFTYQIPHSFVSNISGFKTPNGFFEYKKK